MGRVVLDTSVILGFAAREDPHHEAAKTALEECANDVLAVPAVAYAEVMVGAFRSGSAAIRQADRLFEALGGDIVPLDRDIARMGAHLRARHSSLRIADALIIATGEQLDAIRILTADARWRRVSERVSVIE